MALCREQIEHMEHGWSKDSETPWQNWSYSRKWLKKQMNKFIRLKGKQALQNNDDISGGKQGRKPCSGWEW